VEWYDELLLLTGSPVVRLNRAVAVGEADGARPGLAALDGVSPDLPRYAAVTAYLHERAGDLERAAELYAEAARVAVSTPSATTSPEKPHGCTNCCVRERGVGPASFLTQHGLAWRRTVLGSP
jgi:predicted RNA polymerase sigma factor